MISTAYPLVDELIISTNLQTLHTIDYDFHSFIKQVASKWQSHVAKSTTSNFAQAGKGRVVAPQFGFANYQVIRGE